MQYCRASEHTLSKYEQVKFNTRGLSHYISIAGVEENKPQDTVTHRWTKIYPAKEGSTNSFTH